MRATFVSVLVACCAITGPLHAQSAEVTIDVVPDQSAVFLGLGERVTEDGSVPAARHPSTPQTRTRTRDASLCVLPCRLQLSTESRGHLLYVDTLDHRRVRATQRLVVDREGTLHLHYTGRPAMRAGGGALFGISLVLAATIWLPFVTRGDPSRSGPLILAESMAIVGIGGGIGFMAGGRARLRFVFVPLVAP